MKSQKSAKPAKSSRTDRDFTTTIIGLTTICVAGVVLVIGARSAPKADTSSATAAASTPANVVLASTPLAGASGPNVAVKTASVQAKPEPVTITGCLERDDDTFRLKDTNVVTEPQGRSWKTGFLKKGSSAIEIVDRTKQLHLDRHVGKRVSVTGTLAYRQMQGQSVKRVAASCAAD